MINCVILCGGKSERMGENKILLTFCDKSLVGFQLLKLQNIFERVFISCKQSQKNIILNALKNDGIAAKNELFLIEKEEIFAPIFGIHHALQQINQKIFFAPCDCPFITESSIKKIILKSKHAQVAFAKTLNAHPLLGIWDSELKNKLKIACAKKQFKIMDFLSGINSVGVEISSHEAMNLNTKNDYQNALDYAQKIVR